jgi:hypothetical protein
MMKIGRLRQNTIACWPDRPLQWLKHPDSFGRFEVAVSSDGAAKTVEAITAAARTGLIGDGKIFVMTLEHAVRIRTSETHSDAL